MISCNSLILTLWFRAIEAWFTPGAVSGARGTVEPWGTNCLTLVRVGTPVPLVTHGACFLTSQGVVTGLTSSPTNTKQTLQLLVMESTLNIQMKQCIQLTCLWYWIVKFTDVLLLEVSGHSYPEGQLMQAVWFPTEYVPSWQGIWVFLLVIGQALKKL